MRFRKKSLIFVNKTIKDKNKSMKTGLVLEGGGMRGLFSEGFIDVMQEANIKVDGIIGVSAGALFGCNFKSHQVGRGLRYNIRFKDDSRYMGWRSFLTTGNFVNAKFAYHTMPMELDVFDTEAFEADPTEFYLVCCDIEKGEPVYQRIDHVEDETLEWFRATGSMPIVSTPVEINRRKLLDGGMVDCIPLKHLQSIGYERNIVILTRPKGYQKTPNKLTTLFRMFYPKYPKVAELMAQRHEMYNAELQYIEEQERAGNILAIYPDHPLNIGRTELNEEKLRAIYQHGQEKGKRMLDKVKEFLQG